MLPPRNLKIRPFPSRSSCSLCPFQSSVYFFFDVRKAGMPLTRCLEGEPDPLCCAPESRDIPPRSMKVRQLLSWTRPATPADMPIPPQFSRQTHALNNGGMHEEEETVYVPFEDEVELCIDVIVPSGTVDIRASTIHISKEMVVPHLTNNKTEAESEDKTSACTKFSASHPGSCNDKGTIEPPTLRCSSDDSSHSSKSSLSNLRCAITMPTKAESSMQATTEALSPATVPPPKVIFRKGEKSFLEFHQHYAITKHLGEGSYSTVKQVTHRKKGGVYACKIVDKLSLSEMDRSALSHEVRVLSSVNHVNIMRLYEVIEDDSKCYLVTELAEGGDLFDRIVKQGKFPEHEAQKVTAALVEALHYCHAHSIIHRDVKPENVLLSGDDVKLCDFGFARQLNHPGEQASDSCGTPGYAAPEILEGRSYGLEVDVFSLGVVTYILLCGYPPFPMKLAQLRTHRFNVRYPSKDWAAIHADVKTLISKMLHVDPKERPSMAALRTHPWIQTGNLTLDRLRQEIGERRRLADLDRRQQAASEIRKNLVMSRIEAVKYGRNGLPHRTKLRLSADGKFLSWQPKLLKRSLLRYQNARSFTSLFGIGGKDPNGTSQHDLQTGRPQINRTPTSGVACMLDIKHNELGGSDNATSGASPHSTNSSPDSTTSVINENRLWWRSLRRKRGKKTERTASGGFTLSFTTRQTGSTPSSPITPPAAKMLRLRSPSPTLEQPSTPSAKSPDRLDDSIKLCDIREIMRGDDAPFFTGHAMNLPNSSKRAVDPACVLSVCTRFRELHLEFPDEGIRDGFMFLLQQATLPLQHRAPIQHPHLIYPMSTPLPSPSTSPPSDSEKYGFVPTTPPDVEPTVWQGGSSQPKLEDVFVEAVAK